MALRDDIYNALLASAKAGPFFRVSYEPSTGESSTGVQTTSEDLVSVVGNEISADFDRPNRNRRTFRDAREAWRWTLILEFNQEVTLQLFEDDWMDNPRIVKPSTGPAVFVRLERAEYDHPVQHQGNKGTEARLTFRADSAPV